MSTTCVVSNTSSLISLADNAKTIEEAAIATCGQKAFAIPYMSGEFNAENCFYPKALNTSISPIVKKFFNMKSEAIIKRYAQLNPSVDTAVLRSQLEYKTKHFKWAGQLFY